MTVETQPNDQAARRTELVDSLSVLLDKAIGERRQTVAEETTRLLLQTDLQEARTAVSTRLEGLAPIKSKPTAEAILRATGRRGLGAWPKWIGAIDDAVIGQAVTPAVVERLAAAAWRLSVAKTEDRLEALDAALSTLEPLARNVEWNTSKLTRTITADLETPATDDATAARQARLLAVVQRFRRHSLLPDSEIALSAVEPLVASASAALPVQPIGSNLAQHLMRWVPWVANQADPTSQSRLRDAAQNSPWLPSPDKENLVVALGAQLQEAGEVDVPRFTADQVRELTIAHGEHFAPGLAIWITAFADNPEEVAAVTQPLWRTTLLPVVASAVSQYAERGNGRHRLRLVEPALDEGFDQIPDESFLRAARFSESDTASAVDILIRLFNSVGNNDQREAVLRLWALLAPVDNQQRRRLVNEIFLPLVRSGKQALDIALSYLSLALPPPYGTATAIKETLSTQASGKDQKKRVDRRLKEAGMTRRGIFGR